MPLWVIISLDLWSSNSKTHESWCCIILALESGFISTPLCHDTTCIADNRLDSVCVFFVINIFKSLVYFFPRYYEHHYHFSYFINIWNLFCGTSWPMLSRKMDIKWLFDNLFTQEIETTVCRIIFKAQGYRCCFLYNFHTIEFLESVWSIVVIGHQLLILTITLQLHQKVGLFNSKSDNLFHTLSSQNI